MRICKCLETLVSTLGNNILFFKDNDKLINLLAQYMSDASQEVRAISKNSFVIMSQAVMG